MMRVTARGTVTVRSIRDLVRKRVKRLQSRARLARLRRRNRTTAEPVTGTAPCVVSLTTFGGRTSDAAYAIESIAAGRVRPQRMILWLDEQATLRNLPAPLARLGRRGLEIRPASNYGPHKKYFPYVMAEKEHSLPLVTADDDVLYPSWWLQRLIKTHKATPTKVSCYRANVVHVRGHALAPYDEWPRARDTVADITRFATGVSGVLYPPHMLRELARRGDAFRHTCPTADDIWLHWVALRTGTPVGQVSSRPRHFPLIPGSQATSLMADNVAAGANDAQIRALYTAEDISALQRADEQLRGLRNRRLRRRRGPGTAFEEGRAGSQEPAPSRCRGPRRWRSRAR